jgi:hypothetical protein
MWRFQLERRSFHGFILLALLSLEISRLAQILLSAGLETRFSSRQGAKNAEFGILFFLCGLCVFAGDPPSFGCGSTALYYMRFGISQTINLEKGLTGGLF